MAEANDLGEEFLPFHLCDDLVCCVVCYEPFSEERIPKALPCLHSFCKSCLTAYIQTHQRRSRARHHDRKSPKGEFPCPVCKDTIKIPQNGLDGFRDDFRIRRISEIVAKSREIMRNSSSENLLSIPDDPEEKVKDVVKCDVCKLSNARSPGKQYCLDCFKILCGSCVESHAMMALTSDHHLVDVPDSVKESPLPGTSTCSQHMSEPLKYYCTDCEHVLCLSCSIESDHKAHRMIRLADQVSSVKPDISSALGSAWTEVFDTERKLDEIDSLERELKGKEMSVKRAILSKTLEEIFRARQRQNKMEQDLEEICAQKLKVLEQERERCKSFTKVARKQCSFVENILDHGQELHVVHVVKEYLPNLKSFTGKNKSSTISKITELGKYDTFLTELYDAKENSGENSQESILAEIRSVVSEIRQLSSAPSKARNTESPKSMDSPTQPEPKKDVELIRKIGRKGNKESEFSFPSGIAFLPNGELAVADMHNHRIQIFGKDGNFSRSFGNPSFKPCGITINHDGNLVVTDCTSGKSGIKIMSPKGEVKSSLGEGLFEYPFSIAIDTKDRYIVCDSGTNRIMILKESGALYRRFATKTKFAFYLTVNHRDEILLSDWYTHCVKVFDMNGSLLRKIGSEGVLDGQLMVPLGLCTDKNGNILVLDCKCVRVSLFTPDGKFIKQLIGKDGGIEYSRAIALSDTGMFAVSSGDNRGNIPNEVRLFKVNAYSSK